jgi:hypothetical protein
VDAGQAITEIGSLSDAITGTDVTSQFTGPAGVSFVGRSAGGKAYVLAVNPSSSDVSGSFADTFGATSRHVYVLP